MNLVASLIVRDELDRYLVPCVEHLLEFCDAVRVHDDGSTDGSPEALQDLFGDLVDLQCAAESRFFAHEGDARQQLLEWTMAANPTHILAIDADELIADGARLRAALEEHQATPVWSVVMQEVWKADGDVLSIRQDGGWREHPVPILYQVPRRRDGRWRIPPKQLACGRTPQTVAQRVAQPTSTEILHFGWACEADRAARHQRYVVADGGRFHQSRHLDSIMWPDAQVALTQRRWPASLAAYRGVIPACVNRQEAEAA